MPKANRRRSARRVLNLTLVAVVLVSGLVEYVNHPSRAKSASSAVTTAALNLRTGPSLDHEILLVIPEGAAVDVSGSSSGGFYPVVYQGTDGWSHGDYLDFGGSWNGAATITSDLNLRSGPSTAEFILAVMPTGASVSLTGNSRNGFFELTYNGTGGWGFGEYISSADLAGNLESGDLPAGGSVISSAVTTSELNLRAGASTGHVVLLVMPAGAQVDLLGDPQNGFYPVAYQNQTGWSYGDYLSIGGSASDPPASGGGIVDIIYAAADAYGQDRAAMLQVAQCESVLDPNAFNPYSGASGLFQFLPSTWASTPFAGDNIFDPWASANAAAWMWSVGRRGEWVC
ncbi:MAG: SH3 domain-containing protein [Thermomicrobiales bacterium]